MPPANYCLAPQYDLSSIDFGTNVPYHHHQQEQQLAARQPMVKHLSPSLSCSNSISSTSSSQMSMVINKDRKRRRMISNRESARRSRMRKQRQLQELCTQVLWLRDQNHGLMDRINRLLESQKQVMEENHKLKKESLELRKLLSEAQLATTYNGLGDIGLLRDLDEDDGYEYMS